MNGLTGDLGAIADPYANGVNYDPNARTNIYNPAGSTSIGQFELDRNKAIADATYKRLQNFNQYLQ